MPKLIKDLPDQDNLEWTKEKLARAKRFNELPASLLHALPRKTRGPQKAATKEMVSIRLSLDVLTALRAKGRGWQTLVDESLRKQFVKTL